MMENNMSIFILEFVFCFWCDREYGNWRL